MNGDVAETAVSVQILNLLQTVTQGYELSYPLLIMTLHCHCNLINSHKSKGSGEKVEG